MCSQPSHLDTAGLFHTSSHHFTPNHRLGSLGICHLSLVGWHGSLVLCYPRSPEARQADRSLSSFSARRYALWRACALRSLGPWRSRTWRFPQEKGSWPNSGEAERLQFVSPGQRPGGWRRWRMTSPERALQTPCGALSGLRSSRADPPTQGVALGLRISALRAEFPANRS